MDSAFARDKGEDKPRDDSKDGNYNTPTSIVCGFLILSFETYQKHKKKKNTLKIERSSRNDSIVF